MNNNISWLGFNGEYLDDTLDNYHLGNGYRAYNPSIMQFTAPDDMSPFGKGGINPYVYVSCDPINNTDPTGHFLGLSLTGVIGLANMISPVQIPESFSLTGIGEAIIDTGVGLAGDLLMPGAGGETVIVAKDVVRDALTSTTERVTETAGRRLQPRLDPMYDERLNQEIPFPPNHSTQFNPNQEIPLPPNHSTRFNPNQEIPLPPSHPSLNPNQEIPSSSRSIISADGKLNVTYRPGEKKVHGIIRTLEEVAEDKSLKAVSKAVRLSQSQGGRVTTYILDRTKISLGKTEHDLLSNERRLLTKSTEPNKWYVSGHKAETLYGSLFKPD